jgi:23S rRNA pseudouridine2605 synthase
VRILPKRAMKMTQRINRILSEAGLASRRKADELITSGRVMLNGKILRELGVKAEWGKDSIKLDGREIPEPEEKIYLMLNKPFGYVCTLHDPQGRPIVTDLLKDIPQRVYPVGRLDFDSMGLLLLTNDGDFSFQVTHPKFHLPRTYKVTVQGLVTGKDIQAMTNGMELEDGPIRASNASLLGHQGEKSLVRLTIALGRNRIVRRMFEELGYTVIHLVRIGFGNLELGNLKVGKYRRLEPDEITELLEKKSQDGSRRKAAAEKEAEEKEEKAPRASKGIKSPRGRGVRISRDPRRQPYEGHDGKTSRAPGIKSPRGQDGKSSRSAGGRAPRGPGDKTSRNPRGQTFEGHRVKTSRTPTIRSPRAQDEKASKSQGIRAPRGTGDKPSRGQGAKRQKRY